MAIKKFESSKWNEYKMSDVQVKITGPTNLVLVCPDGREFFGNLTLFAKGQHHDSKYFLLDQGDKNWLADNCFNQAKQTELLASLESFMKLRKNKQIYIRTFPTLPFSTVGSEENRRVFLEEALEIVSIISKKQKDTVVNLEDRLNTYRNQWKCTDIDVELSKHIELVFKTIHLKEFEKILADFDIDKGLITILPDPYVKFYEQNMLNNEGTPILYVSNPEMQPTLHKTQAVFHIFQCVVCSVDWTKEYCTSHKNCMAGYKKNVLDEMRRYLKMDEKDYVLSSYVDLKIDNLKVHCNYQKRKDHPTKFQIMNDIRNDEMVLLDNMPMLTPAQAVRFELMNESLKEFFDTNRDKELVEMVTLGIMFKIPESEREFGKISMSRNPQDGEEEMLRKLMDDMNNGMPKEEVRKILNDINRGKSKAQSSPEPKPPVSSKVMEPVKSSPEAKTEPKSMEPTKSSMEPTAKPKPTEPVKSSPEPKPLDPTKSCSNCAYLEIQLKSAENELKQAKIAQKSSQNAKKSTEELEKKAKRVDDLDAKMKELRRELEKTKKNEQAIKETMKTRLKNKEDEIGGLKETIASLSLVESNNVELELKLSSTLEENRIQLENIVQLTDRVDQLEERLQKYSNPIQPEDPTHQKKNTRWTLYHYQRIKDNISSSGYLKGAREMMERFPTVTQDEALLNLCKYEEIQFEGSLRILQEVLQMNIQKIKLTESVSDLLPLPAYPTLSQKFLAEHYKLQDSTASAPAQPRHLSTGFCPKMTCYYCHENFQEGQDIIRCLQCTQEVHEECGEWTKSHEKCGYCMQKLKVNHKTRAVKTFNPY